jgi:hypothetical protein
MAAFLRAGGPSALIRIAVLKAIRLTKKAQRKRYLAELTQLTPPTGARLAALREDYIRELRRGLGLPVRQSLDARRAKTRERVRRFRAKQKARLKQRERRYRKG